MRELFRIGHFSINIFGVMIALGMIIGILVVLREAKRKRLNEDSVFDLLIYTIIAAIIGARLYYVVGFNFSYYLKNPLEIIFINLGGLSIQGGLIGGILFAVWYTKKKGLLFWETADTIVPGIAIGQAIGRIGCDIFGVTMKSIYPWGIKVGSQIVHPAQLYEMVLDLLLFTYLWRKRGMLNYKGELFIKYIIGFSINRAIVEFFRANPVIIKPFTIAHVTSFIMIVIAIITGKIIKNKYQIEQDTAANDTVKVPVYQYVLIFSVGVVGAAVYYFINSNL